MIRGTGLLEFPARGNQMSWQGRKKQGKKKKSNGQVSFGPSVSKQRLAYAFPLLLHGIFENGGVRSSTSGGLS